MMNMMRKNMLKKQIAENNEYIFSGRLELDYLKRKGNMAFLSPPMNQKPYRATSLQNMKPYQK